MKSDRSKKLSVLLYSDTNMCEKIQRCVDSIFVTSGLSPEKIQILFLKPAAWKNEIQVRTGMMAVSNDEGGGQAEDDTEDENNSDKKAVRVRQKDRNEAGNGGVKNDAPGYGAAGGSTESSPVDQMTVDELLDSLKKQYTRSLEVIDVNEMDAPQAYNLGLERVQGEYVSFMLSSSCYSENALQLLVPEDGAELKEKLISLQPVYCGDDGKLRPYSILPYRDGIRDGMLRRQFIQPVLQAYLIGRGLLEGIRLREDLHEEAFIEAALELQSRNDGKFQYSSSDIYYYTAPLEDDEARSILPRQEWWYIDSVKNFLLDFMQKKKQQYDGKVPLYIQNVIYYLLCVKYEYNLGSHDKLVLKKEDVFTFFDLSCELLTMIDNEVIYQSTDDFQLLPRSLRMAFLKEKAEKMGYRRGFSHADNVLLCDFYLPDENQLITRIKVGSFDDESINFRVINYNAGKLEMDGYLQLGGYLGPDECELYGEIEGGDPVRIAIERNAAYDLQKCFGVTYSRKCSVHLEVPVSELLGAGRKLTFYVKFAGGVRPLSPKFSSVNSRLLSETEKAYWRFDRDRYILYRKEASLYVEKSGIFKVLRRELSLDMEYLRRKDPVTKELKETGDRKEARDCVKVRLLYWLLRPYYRKKRIWLTFDKLYKAGDNGEYFFRYCQTRNDGIDCYYVINENAKDCARLEKEYGKMILRGNTLRCRLLALYAEATMSTHANPVAFVGFPGTQSRYIKGLYRADDVCIQHGLTIQKIAQIQNRIISNTKLYCCASPYEVRNIEHPIYGYRPDMIKLTGLARYDGLKSQDKKQILITPTWRPYLAMPAVMGSARPYNPDFKYTDYFRIYEELISDDRLIQAARETGYELIYLLHPVVSSQKRDYTVKDGVKLVSALEISYEQMLTESSLMVTDYSGVQYDFAYQRKPVVYYHPDALPPHYGEGGMDYEEMGFGPIHKEHEPLVDCLCRYMREGCRMEDKYLERVNRFFAYSDFNNSERIYEEVLKMENRGR